jgi:oxygen-independent coproporphyrinogen-3 oxidase
MKAKPIGLYVHIPFCKKKCNYCDFCSFSNLDESCRKTYITKLIGEIGNYKREERIKVDTVFFGGGTPSLLSPKEFELIGDAIYDSFCIMENAEFTVEANPGTVSEEKIRTLISCGVNRISLGMQTIHENELKILGRIHTYNKFLSAYNLVRKCGIENISIDVMYGIPEQTMDSYKKTLGEVVALKPEHISAYGLILEENTDFWNRKSRLNLPSEDVECDMYFMACELLMKNGYSHYEISNFAKPGFESRHNLKYWRDEEYIGVGIAAHSYFKEERFSNSDKLPEYLSQSSANYISRELIDKNSHAYEYAMLALRLSSGFSLSEYQEKFGLDFLSSNREKVDRYIEEGYMHLKGDRISLSEKGFYVSNTILTDLL